MDGHDDRPHAREPQIEDLARIRAALNAAETIEVQGVPVVVASPATLIRIKDTFRPSDHADRRYLDALIAERHRLA